MAEAIERGAPKKTRPAIGLRQSSYAFIVSIACLSLAGCENLSRFGLGDNDGLSPEIQGQTIRTAVTPTAPKVRQNPALLRAAEKENLRIIQSYGGIYQKEELEILLARMVSKLVFNSDVPSQGFKITILNSPTVNAFALPGGFLYITRGLLSLASDEAEVAAVLAHEMAHVNANHGQERLKRARNTKLVSQAVKNVFGDASDAEDVLARREIDFAAFSQAQEFAADEIGVKNSGRAGYDPFAASRFLEKMGRYQGYVSNSSVTREDERNFLSSHPTTPNRINKAQLAARQFGAPGIGDQKKSDYLKAINGMTFGDDPKEGFVRDRTFIHPQLRFTFTVPPGYMIENTSSAVLATAENKDAMRFDGVAVPNDMPLEAYLASGWLNGFIPGSVKTFKINGAEAASAEARVDAWSFKISVIRSEFSTYRMIFATQAPSTGFDRAVSTTVASFRTLSEREANAVSPLKVRTRTVRAGDTSLSISREMRGIVAAPLEAFLVLNGKEQGERLKRGEIVKVIVEK